MTQNQLATINQQSSVIPTAEEWSTIHSMAKALLPTGFLPNTIKTPEQATAIMLRGRELNIPPMYALSNIVVVQGKPTANAELMLALVQRDHGIDAMWVEESTNEYCTVGYRGGRKDRSYTFSIKDAEQAGLFKNQVWKQYPAAMLRARAISAVARMAFPGSIAGMYVPGELGEDVTVSEDGEITSVSTTAEIVDTDTGEIHEPPAPQKTPKQKASARVHAVGNEHGITHDDIHRMVVALGGSGVTNASAKALSDLADRIEANPTGAKDWAAKLAAQDATESTESDESEEQEAVPASDDSEPSQGVIEIPAEFEAEYRAKAEQYTR